MNGVLQANATRMLLSRHTHCTAQQARTRKQQQQQQQQQQHKEAEAS